jgi:DNA-binding LytR/AlgR family response regulator
MKMQRKKIIDTTDKRLSPFSQIHVGSRTYLSSSEIVMISAETSYSYIHLNDGKRIIVSTNIQKLQERLLGVRNMVRVHRSHIINTRYLKSIDGAKAYLTHDNQCVISRRKRIDLINAIQIIK